MRILERWRGAIVQLFAPGIGNARSAPPRAPTREGAQAKSSNALRAIRQGDSAACLEVLGLGSTLLSLTRADRLALREHEDFWALGVALRTEGTRRDLTRTLRTTLPNDDETQARARSALTHSLDYIALTMQPPVLPTAPNAPSRDRLPTLLNAALANRDWGLASLSLEPSDTVKRATGLTNILRRGSARGCQHDGERGVLTSARSQGEPDAQCRARTWLRSFWMQHRSLKGAPSSPHAAAAPARPR